MFSQRKRSLFSLRFLCDEMQYSFIVKDRNQCSHKIIFSVKQKTIVSINQDIASNTDSSRYPHAQEQMVQQSKARKFELSGLSHSGTGGLQREKLLSINEARKNNVLFYS